MKINSWKVLSLASALVLGAASILFAQEDASNNLQWQAGEKKKLIERCGDNADCIKCMAQIGVDTPKSEEAIENCLKNTTVVPADGNGVAVQGDTAPVQGGSPDSNGDQEKTGTIPEDPGPEPLKPPDVPKEIVDKLVNFVPDDDSKLVNYIDKQEKDLALLDANCKQPFYSNYMNSDCQKYKDVTVQQCEQAKEKLRQSCSPANKALQHQRLKGARYVLKLRTWKRKFNRWVEWKVKHGKHSN